MEGRTATSKSRDILSNPWLAFAVWWLPAIAIAVAGSPKFSDVWRIVVWTASLTIMGAACIVNALQCKRVHCYITGPFFFLMALVTLLFGLGVVPLGRNGWNWLGLTILIGAVALWCLPELVWGKYRKSRAGEGNYL
jgi:hypothetical protein